LLDGYILAQKKSKNRTRFVLFIKKDSPSLGEEIPNAFTKKISKLFNNTKLVNTLVYPSTYRSHVYTLFNSEMLLGSVARIFDKAF
jgi:hypothetical protein